MPANHRARLIGGAIPTLTVTILLAACGSGASPTQRSSPVAPAASAIDLPLPAPGGVANPGGGGAPGDPGSGVPSGGGAIDPVPVEPGQADLVRPLPGRLNPRPSAPQKLEASVDGRRVLVKLFWYGGIEPCSVLDSVKVVRAERVIAITIFEGSSDLDAVCIDIAKLKATIVDLGELEPGPWTIGAPDGSAPPLRVTIE
jgi:hypothetical protein